VSVRTGDEAGKRSKKSCVFVFSKKEHLKEQMGHIEEINQISSILRLK
jgi:hypothetical protein